MKKTILTIILACAAIFMTQCKKADVQKPTAGETIDVTLRVVDNGTKTEIGADGNVIWKTGDKIHVVGQITGYLGYLTAVEDGEEVTFSGAINYSSVKQMFHYYYVGSNAFSLDETGNYTLSIATGQDGTLATIADKFQLMYGNSGEEVPVGTADLGETVMTTKTAIGNFKFTRTDGAPFVNTIHVIGAYTSMKFNTKTGRFDEAVIGGNDVMLTLNYTENSNYYMSLIPGEQTINFSQYVVDNEYTKTVVENALYQEKTVDMNGSEDVPEGALPGKFKISNDNDYVYFSKGNLYCNSELTEWGFEENQWDYHSCPVDAVSNPNGGWQMVDGVTTTTGCTKWGLFGYSTNAANNNYGASYSTTSVDYSGDFKDWGENIGTGWFTLNYDQLHFLHGYGSLKTSGNTSFKLVVGKAETTIKGMAILPSDTPSGEVTAIINDIKGDMNKLKSYGAVFFPQTSRREGTARRESAHGYIRYQQTGKLYFYGSTSDGNFWSCSNHYGGLVRLVYPVSE